jgi:hypothetical protein
MLLCQRNSYNLSVIKECRFVLWKNMNIMRPEVPVIIDDPAEMEKMHAKSTVVGFISLM